jgi:transposase
MCSKFEELTDSQWEYIKDMLPIQRKRKLDLRKVVNAILWIVRTGCQWRNLDSERFYKWQSVYYYFYNWSQDGTIEALNLVMNYEARRQKDRSHSDPSLACVDSQSIKLAPRIAEERGTDGGKNVNGRKRQLMVDTLGLIWCVYVHAANIHDSKGAKPLIDKAYTCSSRLKKILIDYAYQGQFIEYAKEQIPELDIEIASKPPSEKGFVPVKKRWIVERSFAWLNFFRRLVIDYERTTRSAEAMILLANISMSLNKIK